MTVYEQHHAGLAVVVEESTKQAVADTAPEDLLAYELLEHDEREQTEEAHSNKRRDELKGQIQDRLALEREARDNLGRWERERETLRNELEQLEPRRRIPQRRLDRLSVLGRCLKRLRHDTERMCDAWERYGAEREARDSAFVADDELAEAAQFLADFEADGSTVAASLRGVLEEKALKCRELLASVPAAVSPTAHTVAHVLEGELATGDWAYGVVVPNRGTKADESLVANVCAELVAALADDTSVCAPQRIALSEACSDGVLLVAVGGQRSQARKALAMHLAERLGAWDHMAVVAIAIDDHDLVWKLLDEAGLRPKED